MNCLSGTNQCPFSYDESKKQLRQVALKKQEQKKKKDQEEEKATVNLSIMAAAKHVGISDLGSIYT